MKKQLFRLIAFLFFVVFFSSWALLTVNALGPIRSTPSFSASFNNGLSSSWGSFYNNGPFYNGCTNPNSMYIANREDCARFYNTITFPEINGGYYAYRRLSSPLKTNAQLYGTDGLTIEFSLKLDSLPTFNYDNFDLDNNKIGQTGFVVNIRCGEKDTEFYLCFYQDPQHSGKLCVSSYSGSRSAINTNAPQIINNISYSPTSFTKFSLVFEKSSAANASPYQGTAKLYVNGGHAGNFTNLTHRGAGSMQESFVYFSLVSRPQFSSYDGANFDATSSVWLDYVNIFNKPMPQPGSLANVPLYGQTVNNRCSAASARMTFASLGVYASENDIWQAAGGEAGNTNILAAFNQYLDSSDKYILTYNDYQSYASNSQILDSNLQYNLNQGYPVVLFLTIPADNNYFGYSSSGHVVVVSGYKTENGVSYYEIHDPWSGGSYTEYSGQVTWIPIQTLFDYFSNHSYSMLSHYFV